MTIKRRKKWDTWALNLEDELRGLGVSKHQFARLCGMDSASLYRWFRKPLNTKQKVIVGTALEQVRRDPLAVPETPLQMVDRLVDKNTKVGEGEVLRTICTILRASGACRGPVTTEEALELLRVSDEFGELVAQWDKERGRG